MALPARLRDFADGLAPSEQTKKRIDQSIDQIKEDLENYFDDDPKIDRIENLGSIGKKTSLWPKMDIDIVVYFNDVTPPFCDVIKSLETIVRSRYDRHCRATKHGIMFKYEEFSVDLLPATKFIPCRRKVDDVIKAQVNGTLKYLSRHPNLRPDDFSTSLSEAAVDFQKEQDAYTHALCRLAKYWAMTFSLTGYCPGRSTVIELLAVKAGQDTISTQNIVIGFRKFLFAMRTVSRQRIYWERYYKKNQISPEHLEEATYLMDPSNPFNNLLNPRVVQYLERMKPFVNRTLRFLKDAEQRFVYRIDRVFFRPPTLDRLNEDSDKIPDNYLIGVETIPSIHIPLLRIRRSGLRFRELQSICNIFSTFVYAASQQLNLVNCEIDEEDEYAIHSCMEGFIGGDWYWCDESHDDRDVSYYLPIGRWTNTVAIVSFDWCDKDYDSENDDYESDDYEFDDYETKV